MRNSNLYKFLPVLLHNKPYGGLPIFYFSSANTGQENISQTRLSNNSGIRDSMAGSKQLDKLGPNYHNNNSNNGGRKKHEESGELWCNDMFLLSSLLCLSPLYHFNMYMLSVTPNIYSILANIFISLSFIHFMCILTYTLIYKRKKNFFSNTLKDIHAFFNRPRVNTINIKTLIVFIIVLIVSTSAIWVFKSYFISILSIGSYNKLLPFWLSLSMSSLIRYLMTNINKIIFKPRHT